ncbi:Receptor-like kinase [Melia azedarach]|uniref:Receptor-like kinase n=1 Tax=Melia azedarach TaxID=155640 RepID=A0ACC1XRC3_MELAZ|nr:Receptor-like kinase [Melia azedarach]
MTMPDALIRLHGIVAAVTGIAIACIIICIFRRKIWSILSKICCRRRTKIDQDLEAFIRNHGPLALKRYSFSHVKKMTNSFKDKLGQGGYGGVYKGKLSDGHLVAVKLLNTSKGNGQEFINEVASISKTSHVNVISLLGYCLEVDRRVLIYEFMPNGSLEIFIYKGDTLKSGQQLGWEKLYQIAIGIGRGLEYLRREVFNRNFGNVSHKSDVYSYGMMVLEMVGCRENPNAGVCNTGDLYFPHWIYKHFEEGKEFELPSAVTSEEKEIAKKMIIVGLWCIQTRPIDRPSINIVLEMLQGSIDTSEIPPMPSLSSPTRPPIHSSTTSLS